MIKFRLLISVFVAIVISGCGVSNWNVGKTVGQQEQSTKTPTQTAPVEIEKPKTPTLHIDKIIQAWGSPTKIEKDALNRDVYIWENCKATGLYVDKCDDSGCKTVPETKCCERVLNTDENGNVTNLKDAVNSCM